MEELCNSVDKMNINKIFTQNYNHYEDSNLKNLQLTTIVQNSTSPLKPSYKSSGTWLNCRFEELYDLPDRVEDYQYIDCSGNFLKHLLYNFRKVVHLDCSENQISTIPESMIYLPLHHLDLSRNNIESLPFNFGECKTLKWLNVSSNQLQTLPTLKYMNLEYFNSSWNNNTLMDSIDGLPMSLKYLQCTPTIKMIHYIIGLSITNLICNGDDMNTLNSHEDNGLMKILISYIRTNSNLVEFQINHYNMNPFHHWDSILGFNSYNHWNNNVEQNCNNQSVSSIKYLSVTEMCLTDLTYLKCYSQVSHLNVCRNGLKEIPESIQYLKNLKYLDISYNKITHFPKHLDTLPLEELYCQNNQLEIIPPEIHVLQLKNFIIDGNDIKYIPPNVKRCMDADGFEYEEVADELLEHPYQALPMEFWTTLYRILSFKWNIMDSSIPRMLEELIKCIHAEELLSVECKQCIDILVQGKVDPITKLKFIEILPYVWLRIQNSPYSHQLLKRMDVQILFIINCPVILQISHLISILHGTDDYMIWKCI